MSVWAMVAVALGVVPQGPRYVEHPLVPLRPVPLGGYTARGDALMEPGGQVLFARAVTLAGRNRPITIVVIEGLTVPESLVSAVKNRLGDGVDLMMIATHTHCAPDTQMLNARMTLRVPGIAVFDRSEAEHYANQITELVRRSLGSPLNARQYGWSKTSARTLNRLRRPTGQPYQWMYTLFADHRPLILVNPAHATILGEEERHSNGDWPGYVMRRGIPFAVPGPIGDASPKVDGSTFADVRNYGQRVMALSEALAPNPLASDADSITFRSVPIYLPDATPHPSFAEEYGIVPVLANMAVARFAPTEANLTILKIGNLRIIGVPGEPTGDLARAVENAAGPRPVMIVSHVNGWAGYMLTSAEYDEGGYEATLSFYGRDFPAALLDAVQRGVRD
ncbi:MAG: hypothetical protein KF812_00825 [Fimbriimonadaceae bacterium]|nr:hypothetical protein [Fimbriimonadaceae bacterium]